MALELLTPQTWEDFLAADQAVLMLGKSDCAACNAFTAELDEWLGGDPEAAAGVRFGKILLDQRGFTAFKRGYGDWLREVKDLPTTGLFKGGERVKTFVGGGVTRLESRVKRVYGQG